MTLLNRDFFGNRCCRRPDLVRCQQGTRQRTETFTLDLEI